MQASQSLALSRRTLLQGMGAALAAPITGCAGPARSAAAGAGSAGAAGDWPCFRGPNRNGILETPFKLRAGGPTKLWEAAVGDGNASVAISQGRLYTMTSEAESIICLDANNGRPVWKQRMENHYGSPTPSVENGRVYGVIALGSGDPTAYCCNAASGAFLWKRQMPRSTGDRQYGHAGSPLLWEDLVILNAGAGVALKASTGEPAWVHPGFPGLATPVLFQWQGRPSVALFGGDRLIAREARTGRELWQIPWKTELAVNACDPVIFDNKIFLCSDYGRGRSLYDISGARPRLLWEYGEGRGSSFSSGFFHQGHLYGFAESQFGCLDAANGQLRWQIQGGNAALLVGGTLILMRHSGEVRFGRISPTGYQAVSSFDAGLRDLKAVPAYWHGRLFLRNEKGQLACFQVV